MKAEVPEKIYVHRSQYWGLMANEHNITKNGVEYIRKDIVNSMLEMAIHPTKSEVRRDVFIDKACDWIEEHIYEYLKINKTWNEPDYDPKLIEDFRNHMKGG